MKTTSSKTLNMVARIKEEIRFIIQNNVTLKKNLSDTLAEQLGMNYTYMSNHFSKAEGKTIQLHFIEQKIEKAKQMLLDGDKTLTEIAFQLGYSSVAHLSNQFKKISGKNPTAFKNELPAGGFRSEKESEPAEVRYEG